MAQRMALGEFEQMVLLAVLHLDEEAYGNAICEAIEERTHRAVSRSSLYVTFDRLEAKGFLKSRLADSSAERGGRPRRYVEVTAQGLASLAESRQALLSMWRGLEDVLEEAGS